MHRTPSSFLRWSSIIVIALISATASAIQFHEVTIEDELSDAQYILHVRITDYVSGFRPYEIDGITLITMHRYRVDVIAASATAPRHAEICTNGSFAVGTELVLTRDEVQIANEEGMLGMNGETKQLVIDNCGSLSSYYDASFDLELKKVIDEYHNDIYGKYLELSTERFKAGDTCMGCFTRTTVTSNMDGEEVRYSSKQLYVPISVIEKHL